MPHYCGSLAAIAYYAPKQPDPVTDLQPCLRRNSFIKLAKASTAFMVTAL
jgi:hypothetical protein